MSSSSTTTPSADSFIVAIPTHDRRAIVQSLMELGRVSEILKRPMHLTVSEGSNIPRSRNSAIDQIQYQYPDAATKWMLWLDSDIVILHDSAEIIADAIRWAETNQVAVTGNYRMNTGENVLLSTRGPQPEPHHFTDDELVALPRPYPPVALTGFGFLYLEQPLSYRFHADVVGEDIHFWWDNPYIRLHWITDLHLGHHKAVVLTS